MWIDTSFDFRTDAFGKDPDTHSPTLRHYHKSLWSKPLPGGRPFYLSDATPGAYLHHHSELGEFFLSSDSFIATFTRWKSTRHIVELLPVEENEAFCRIGYTIGGMIVFPGNRIDGKQLLMALADSTERSRTGSISRSSVFVGTTWAKAVHSVRRCRDIECSSLCSRARGYVDFFMLNDLVTEDCSAVSSSYHSRTSVLHPCQGIATLTRITDASASRSSKLIIAGFCAR
jgi:hypothetical protein